MGKTNYYEKETSNCKITNYTFNPTKKIVTCTIKYDADKISHKIWDLFFNQSVANITPSIVIQYIEIKPNMAFYFTGTGMTEVENWCEEEINKAKKEAYKKATLDLHDAIMQNVNTLNSKFNGVIRCYKNKQHNLLKKLLADNNHD